MKEEDKRFANSIGAEYDLFRLALPHHDLVQQETAQEISSHFESRTDEILVLEIGFGTRLTSEILLKDTRIRLVGLDNEEAMLPKALKRLSACDKSKYELLTEDALGYLKKCETESFDAVASVWVLHNLNKEIRFEIYKEIFRVLKKGGVFVNGDKVAVSDEKAHKKHLDWQLEMFDVFVEHGRQNLKDEWTEHYHEDELPDRILIEDVMYKELSSVGFINTEITKRWYMDAVVVSKK